MDVRRGGGVRFGFYQFEGRAVSVRIDLFLECGDDEFLSRATSDVVRRADFLVGRGLCMERDGEFGNGSMARGAGDPVRFIRGGRWAARNRLRFFCSLGHPATAAQPVVAAETRSGVHGFMGLCGFSEETCGCLRVQRLVGHPLFSHQEIHRVALD